MLKLTLVALLLPIVRASVDRKVLLSQLPACERSYEPVLLAILRGLAREGTFDGPGARATWSVLDVGANTGHESCHLATALPHHTIHAVDPSPGNIASIRDRYGKFDKLEPMLGALSNTTGWIRVEVRTRPGDQPDPSAAKLLASASQEANVPVNRLDDLYLGKWAPQRLSLAHIDTNGNEVALLQGAHSVILRDRPVMVVEISVDKQPRVASQVLELLTQLNYDSWVVHEGCGRNYDCRNLICLPRERDFGGSSTLDLAFASGAIYRLNGSGDELTANKPTARDRSRRAYDALVRAVSLPCAQLGLPSAGDRHPGCSHRQLENVLHAEAVKAARASNLSVAHLLANMYQPWKKRAKQGRFPGQGGYAPEPAFRQESDTAV